jgi:hypothetical protein
MFKRKTSQLHHVTSCTIRWAHWKCLPWRSILIYQLLTAITLYNIVLLAAHQKRMPWIWKVKLMVWVSWCNWISKRKRAWVEFWVLTLNKASGINAWGGTILPYVHARLSIWRTSWEQGTISISVFFFFFFGIRCLNIKV